MRAEPKVRADSPVMQQYIELRDEMKRRARERAKQRTGMRFVSRWFPWR